MIRVYCTMSHLPIDQGNMVSSVVQRPCRRRLHGRVSFSKPEISGYLALRPFAVCLPSNHHACFCTSGTLLQPEPHRLFKELEPSRRYSALKGHIGYEDALLEMSDGRLHRSAERHRFLHGLRLFLEVRNDPFHHVPGVTSTGMGGGGVLL